MQIYILNVISNSYLADSIELATMINIKVFEIVG